MVKSKLGCLVLSDEQERVLLGVCSDPISTELFVRLLNEVKQSIVVEQSKSAQVYLLNNEPTTRAVALQLKGQIMIVDDLITAVKNVTK